VSVGGPDAPSGWTPTSGGTPYQVVRVVGVGGSGYVYEVKHLELGKRFVLKTLELDGTHREERVERLRAEWRALAKLEHPNIVGVSDARVSGTDLSRRPRVRGALSGGPRGLRPRGSHRSGLAGLPHPAPRFTGSLQVGTRSALSAVSAAGTLSRSRSCAPS